MAEMNTKAGRGEYMTSAVKRWSMSVNEILNYVEPEIAAILDKAGVRVHILRAELFSNMENFLNNLDIRNGEKLVVVTSVHNVSILPIITKIMMTRGIIVRTFISHKLPASMFIIGVVSGLNL